MWSTVRYPTDVAALFMRRRVALTDYHLVGYWPLLSHFEICPDLSVFGNHAHLERRSPRSIEAVAQSNVKFNPAPSLVQFHPPAPWATLKGEAPVLYHLGLLTRDWITSGDVRYVAKGQPVFVNIGSLYHRNRAPV